MNLSYNSRIPEPKDFYSLYSSSGWTASYEPELDAISKSFERSWFCISVWAGDVLVGFGRIVCHDLDCAFVNDVIVSPEYQGRGVGSHIIRLLLAECSAAEISQVVLLSAPGKEQFYERFGFRLRSKGSQGMVLTAEHCR